MKGAKIDPSANTNKLPITSITRTKGINQSFFLDFRNKKSSKRNFIFFKIDY
jgi:hypothetical protein